MPLASGYLSPDEIRDLIHEVKVQPHVGYSIIHVGRHVRKAFRNLRVNFERMSRGNRDAWNKLTAAEKDEWTEQGRWSRLNRNQVGVLPKPQEFLPKDQRISGYATFIQAVAVLAYYNKLVGSAKTQAVEYPEPYSLDISYHLPTDRIRFKHTYGFDVAQHPQYFFNAFQVHPDIKPPMNGYRLTRWLGQRYDWPPPTPPDETITVTDSWRPRWPLTRPGRHIIVYHIFDGTARRYVNDRWITI